MASRSTAKKIPKDTATQEPVRTKAVFAGVCPKHAAHENVSVYKTQGKTRYCKCNDCGSTWKIVGDAAETEGRLSDDDRAFLLNLADGLETAPRSTLQEDGKPVEVIQSQASEADEAAKQLRRIAG